MKARLTLLLLTVLTAAFAVRGQAPAPAPAAPALPQYQVEIVVFANREFDPNEEGFLQEAPVLAGYETLQQPPVFDDSNFGPLAQSPFASGAVGALSAAGAEAPFRLLRREELQLGAEYRRLQAIPAYRPLLHVGWVQAGLSEAQSQPFDLALAGVSNPRGNVRVYLSRFLHVNLDLTYQLDAPTQSAASFGDDIAEVAIAPRYRLLTSRQARSGEIHYFDHPAFGVLVKVTPVTPEADASQPGRPAA